jgi:hypothetical protein
VDKLESFYDFRESCVNAEAMLESYFTSLRFSDDFTREGKVNMAILVLIFSHNLEVQTTMNTCIHILYDS